MKALQNLIFAPITSSYWAYRVKYHQSSLCSTSKSCANWHITISSFWLISSTIQNPFVQKIWFKFQFCVYWLFPLCLHARPRPPNKKNKFGRWTVNIKATTSIPQCKLCTWKSIYKREFRSCFRRIKGMPQNFELFFYATDHGLFRNIPLYSLLPSVAQR